MVDWLYVNHPETGGDARIPDAPGVRERYEALGWRVAADPDADGQVFVPPKVVEQNTEDGWVTLYHSATSAAHRFPSHPDAVQGAYDAGWQASPPKHSDPDPAPAVDESDKVSVKKAPSKSSKANESGASPANEGE